MPISLSCPNCASKLKAPDHLAGRSLHCPRCKTSVSVPAPSATARPPEPPPVAVPVAVVVPDPVIVPTEFVPVEAVEPRQPERKPCPFCGEDILAAAKKCKHCGETLDPTLRAAEEAERSAAARTRRVRPADEDDEERERRPRRRPEPERPARSGRPFFSCGGLLFLILLAIGIMVAVQQDPQKQTGKDTSKDRMPVAADKENGKDHVTPSGPKKGVTRANYERIQQGMSLAEVEEILGRGKEVLSADNLRVMNWEGGIINFRIVSITFEDDRVTAKAILD